MKSLRASLLAAAGAIAGIAVLSLTSFQSVAGFGAASNSWPPGPRSIVNWVAFNEIGPGGVEVPAGGELVLLEVPEGSWLVITDFPEADGSWQVFERLSLDYSLKFKASSNNRPDNSSIVGSTFRPGSQVVVMNRLTTPRTLVETVRFTGYYTR